MENLFKLYTRQFWFIMLFMVGGYFAGHTVTGLMIGIGIVATLTVFADIFVK